MVLHSRDDGRRRSPGRSLEEMVFDQLTHARIPRGISFLTEHNADQVPTVTAHRRDQIITRGLGIPGLYTVDALHFPQ